MFVQELASVVVEHWLLVITISTVALLANNKFYKGLNRYPGHWLAGYTNWWRFFDACNRSPEQTHIRLHQEHGDVVRLGPNVLSFADPKALKVIYGLNKGFTKVNRLLIVTKIHYRN